MNSDKQAVILKYNAQVPRYTSYPTAPHFRPMEMTEVQPHLAALPADHPVSLYLHVPFCHEMCWYCGCHTTATKKYAPVENYVTWLLREIRYVREQLPARLPVSHVHFGGGSPSMLLPQDFLSVMTALRDAFDILPDAEIAIEADPRGVSHDKAEAYAAGGVNRVSFGIQDFAPHVQKAINRVQSYETVEKSLSLCRRFGMTRVNFDLMYGLPLQTTEDVAQTVRLSMQLAPDRIALFGYAHVPWMKKHMRLIRDADLPDGAARLAQFARAEALLTAAGMLPVGIDHFVRAGDSMHAALQNRRLARNFQGYTTDGAETLLGFGASAISRLPAGFSQNAAHMTAYMQALKEKRLPVARGCILTAEDRMRADIIGTLMCYLSCDIGAVLQQHGFAQDMLDGVLEGMADLAADGVVQVQGRQIAVAPEMRQLVRVAAARFDAYFTRGQNRHVQAA